MEAKDKIKETLSIIDVVSTYLKLEKQGSQYKARCPFHNEKTPSFYISQERNTYHCFGCGEHGDIFSFVEKMESVNFYEALTILSVRAGIELKNYKKENKEKEKSLIEILNKAKEHFIKNLENSPEAKIYLAERGLTQETIKEFEIGFSLGGELGWRDLFIELSKKGFSIEQMLSAGLIIKKENEEKYFDRFRGRIMFPIKNSFNNTVAFSARILPKFDNGKMGKYINSPETEIYHKSKILFGYNIAKKYIAEKKEVIITEGQMDLIMSNQVGIKNIIATSGTAISEEHINILKRFADKVLLSFDQDKAGEEAQKKCAFLTLYAGLDVYIIDKKEGIKDVADLINNFGGEEWINFINKKKHIIEFLTEKILKTTNEKREIGFFLQREIIPVLKAINNNIDKDYFIKYVSQKLNVNETSIISEISKIKLNNQVEKKEDDEKINKELFINNLLLLILALITWKNIDINNFFEKEKEKELLDIFLEKSKIIPNELIEKEIIKLENEFNSNKVYIDNSEKFIKNYFDDLIKNYKRKIIKEFISNLEKELKTNDNNNIEKIMNYYKYLQNI